MTHVDRMVHAYDARRSFPNIGWSTKYTDKTNKQKNKFDLLQYNLNIKKLWNYILQTSFFFFYQRSLMLICASILSIVSNKKLTNLSIAFFSPLFNKCVQKCTIVLKPVVPDATNETLSNTTTSQVFVPRFVTNVANSSIR